MSVLATAPHFRAGLLLSLLASAMLFGAGCSFETGASGLECADEGDRRAGEVCRDGYWRIDADTGLDASDRRDVPAAVDVPDFQDVPDQRDGAFDGDSQTDADPDTDACLPRSDQEVCRSADSCSGALRARDECTGAERTIDCRPFSDFETDPLNCGGCGQFCATPGPHAYPTCAGGQCGHDCEAGWVDANGDASDGCELECTPSNGGVEICDGSDNDCDAEVDGADAAGAQPYFRDADDDGFGNPADSIRACDAPEGYVVDDTDCDDADDATNPSAQEFCDGAVDDNCDGAVDEQCSCTNGESQACGTNEGTCQQGAQTCTAGQWAPQCIGKVDAEAEVCDGLDNDCDAQIDEDFADKGSSCTVGQGECVATGSYVCTSDGTGTECDATAGAAAARETCANGLDDDCDGQVDEGCPCDYMGNPNGVCANGVPQPNGDCQAPTTYESQEASCDGLDNDCDGFVDEWVRTYLYPDADGDGYGDESSQRSRVCAGTVGWASNNDDCDDGDPWTNPGADEICDGKDNNCNGTFGDNRDTGYLDASNWCSTHFNTTLNLMCDDDGPGGVVCCEYDGDPNQTYDCDFETICHGGADDDGDGDIDCADVDCNGLSCGPAQTCQSGSCQPI